MQSFTSAVVTGSLHVAVVAASAHMNLITVHLRRSHPSALGPRGRPEHAEPIGANGRRPSSNAQLASNFQ